MASVHDNHKRTGEADKWKHSCRIEAVTLKHEMPNFHSPILGLEGFLFPEQRETEKSFHALSSAGGGVDCEL